MKFDELTEQLSEQEPADWPEPFGALRAPDEPIPEELDRKLRGSIQQAIREIATQEVATPAAVTEEANSEAQPRKPARRVIWLRPALLAAAVLVALIPIALYLYAGRERPTYLLVQRSLGATGLQAGQHLTSRTLRLAAGQEVYLRSGVGRAQLAVRGPAVVHLRIAEVRRRLRLRCRVDLGQLLLRSDPSEPKSIEWSDRGGRYVLRGTRATLTVARSTQRLAVYEGAFDYYPRLGGSSVHVPAGKVLRTSPGKAPVLEGLDRRRRSAFAVEGRRFDLVARGRPFLSRERGLFSRRAIRQHYGALHRVRLKDGRVFYGFSVRGRQELEIHTVFGVLKLQREQVLRIEPVP